MFRMNRKSREAQCPSIHTSQDTVSNYCLSSAVRTAHGAICLRKATCQARPKAIKRKAEPSALHKTGAAEFNSGS